jgi:hypothetical protein
VNRQLSDLRVWVLGLQANAREKFREEFALGNREAAMIWDGYALAYGQGSRPARRGRAVIRAALLGALAGAAAVVAGTVWAVLVDAGRRADK